MRKSIIKSILFLSLLGCTGTCFAYYGSQPRKEYYDEWGRLQGYSKLDMTGRQTNHYNEWGTLQGYSKKDQFTGDVQHYDEWGRLQGTTKQRQW